jgi:hypothetical protein
VLTYLEFHPLALLWLSIALLVIIGGFWTRRRKPALHPYPESTRWREPAVEPAPVLVGAAAGAPARLPWAADHDDWADGTATYQRALFEPAMPDAARLDALRLDAVHPAGRSIDDPRLHGANLNTGPLETVRPYLGRPDGRRQSSRHGRHDPIDSTSPMPGQGERP